MSVTHRAQSKKNKAFVQCASVIAVVLTGEKSSKIMDFHQNTFFTSHVSRTIKSVTTMDENYSLFQAKYNFSSNSSPLLSDNPVHLFVHRAVLFIMHMYVFSIWRIYPRHGNYTKDYFILKKRVKTFGYIITEECINTY